MEGNRYEAMMIFLSDELRTVSRRARRSSNPRNSKDIETNDSGWHVRRQLLRYLSQTGGKSCDSEGLEAAVYTRDQKVWIKPPNEHGNGDRNVGSWSM